MLLASGGLGLAATWTPALGTGGSLVGNTTVTLAGSETETVADVISGAYSLTVSGAGTLELQNANTYTGATTISDGATLKLSTTTFNLTTSSQVNIGADSTLDLAVYNALGYVGTTSKLLQTIQMADGSKILNSVTGNHSNLGNITVLGAGGAAATITGNGSGSADYGNFLLAGKITLEENTSLTMDVAKLTIRRAAASLKDGTTALAGIFEVGTGSIATIGSTTRPATINVFDGSDATTMTKTGAGELTVNGVLAGHSADKVGTFAHEAGTTNLNGNVTNVSLSVKGGTVVTNGYLLGSGAVSVTGGTVEVRGGTYTTTSVYNGDVTVSGTGAKLALYAANTSLNHAKSVTVSNGGELEGNINNPFGYDNLADGFLSSITLKDGGILTNNSSGSETKQMNLPALTVSGTGNILRATDANGSGHSAIGNFAFAGIVTLEANAGLTLTAKKVIIRNRDNSQAGGNAWDIGTGATFTVNTDCEILLKDTDNAGTTLTRTGAGTLTVNGTLIGATSGSVLAHQAGTTNLAGAVSDVKLSVSGGTLNASGGVTGASSLNVTGGTLNLSGTQGGNTFTGDTYVSSGGTLKLSSNTRSTVPRKSPSTAGRWKWPQGTRLRIRDSRDLLKKSRWKMGGRFTTAQAEATRIWGISR